MAVAGINPPKSMDFSNARSTWSAWKQRFERYRTASGLSNKTPEQQVDILIYVMGEEAESIHNQLTIRDQTVEDGTPVATDTIYARTLEAFNGYFNPQENTLHYRILFSSRLQASKETNEQFIREIYELAAKCSWTDTVVKQDMIKTRLMAGMLDKTLSRELQLKPDISLEDIKLAMRSKEVILQNQKCEIDGAAAAVAELSVCQLSVGNKSSRARNPMGQGSQQVEEDRNFRTSNRSYRSQSSNKAAKFSFITDCKFCGLDHNKGQCPAYNKRCNKCSKFNHFARVCKSRAQSRNQAHAIAVQDNSSNIFYSDNQEYFNVNCIFPVDSSHKINSEWLVGLNVKGLTHRVKVDTGAEVNVMSIDTLKNLGVNTVARSGATLSGYSGYKIQVVGKVDLPVALTSPIDSTQNEIIAQFYVINQSAVTLLGLPTSRDLGLLPSFVSEVTEATGVAQILEKHSAVFKGLGKHQKTVSLKLKPDAVPKALPTKHIPSGVREKLKRELDNLEKTGIICKDNEPAEWLSPIVVVNKPNGAIRICLNPQHLNSQLVRSHCMLPTTEEIFSRIAGSCCFSTLDAKQGFHQVPLDDKSSKLVGFLTPYGKYRYLRLPMGLSVAAELFHQLMVDALTDIPGVEVFIDDVLIHGKSLSQHNDGLEQVFAKLKQVGITLNKDKCVVGREQVDFLGHHLTAHGIQPQQGKLEAIEHMMIPQNKKELESYLGFVAYLAKFVQNLSELTVPLRQVCRKGVQFQWEKPQMKAFENIKKSILQSPVLAYFDPSKPITLSSDASAHSLGAVLLQDGRPVEFAAKSLTGSQQNYSQIEKELMAIVFACKRFKYYIWGRGPFKVETDHRSLLGLFEKDLGNMTPRLAKMRLELLEYPIDMHLTFRPGKEMVLADTLSRSCPSESTEDVEVDVDPMLQVCSIVIRSDEVMVKYQKPQKKMKSCQW